MIGLVFVVFLTGADTKPVLMPISSFLTQEACEEHETSVKKDLDADPAIAHYFSKCIPVTTFGELF